MRLGQNCNHRGHGICTTISKRLTTRIGIRAYQNAHNLLPSPSAHKLWEPTNADEISLGQAPDDYVSHRVRGVPRPSKNVIATLEEDIALHLEDDTPYLVSEYKCITWNGIKLKAGDAGQEIML